MHHCHKFKELEEAAEKELNLDMPKRVEAFQEQVSHHYEPKQF